MEYHIVKSKRGGVVKGIAFGLMLVMLSVRMTDAAVMTRIVAIQGVVQVRRGLEETWQPAAVGQALEEMDSILTGEASEVVLKISDQVTFRLGGNSIIDLTDLRRITTQELFLMIMSEKIGTLEQKGEKTPLQLGNVTVVHGSNKSGEGNSIAVTDRWRPMYNGAGALFSQGLYPNAALKLVRIINRYPEAGDCGQCYFLLGRSFAALEQRGQALEAMESCLRKIASGGCDDPATLERRRTAEMAIEQLRP